MRDLTLNEFLSNQKRVENLLDVYRTLRAGGRGRSSVGATDVLRAATVLLHSSLEEVFRNLYRWRLPHADEEILNEIPLAGTGSGRPEKFLLGKLAPYTGRFVQNVILDSIEEYCNYTNINNAGELVKCLQRVSVDPEPFRIHLGELERLMSRRHQIVHQADRNDEPGRGQHRAQSLSIAAVERWMQCVNTFVQAVVAAVPD